MQPSFIAKPAFLPKIAQYRASHETERITHLPPDRIDTITNKTRLLLVLSHYALNCVEYPIFFWLYIDSMGLIWLVE